MQIGVKWRMVLGTALGLWCAVATAGDEKSDNRFSPIDVFGLEFASDPQISCDGTQIVYARNFMDIMKDRARSHLWIVNFEGTEHRPLTNGEANSGSPRWSPDGKRLLYAASENDSTQLFVRWMDTGQTAQLAQLQRAPSGLAWSPDGNWIAFSMLVPEESEPFAKMPPKPKGAEWADPPKVIRKLRYRFDGQGYLEDGFRQLFVLPAEGGTPRQVTHGDFQHDGAPVWSSDGKSLIFSANRHDDWEHDPLNSEIYTVSLETGEITALTNRPGADRSPALSPDGKKIAYVGFYDELRGHHVSRLYVMRHDGTQGRMLTDGLDRDVEDPVWSGDGQGIYFQYDDEGNTKIGYVSLAGVVETVAGDVGGTTLGRPYASGSFCVASDGRFAYTQTVPSYPADVAVGERGTEVRRITHLNDDLLGPKQLGEVEEIWFESSYDGRKIHAWIVKPPGFDPERKYPLILEIHGGPFANYGDRFSAEIQLYAAAGYVVLYANPRGSTSYGDEFANLIHHNYPGQDYDDLMSGVDAVLARGYVDASNLFVTGGSGGGVLSSWIVGKTDRFRAAVVAKPVINWYSFALTSDAYNFFYKYWFPGYPWENAEEYLRRSPLSLVGNVSTPTMLLTGEQDHRTPISESEQFYQALQLRGIDTALVRVPGASHAIASRPSLLIAKVAHVLKWFEMYRADSGE